MEKVFDALKLRPREKKVLNYLMKHNQSSSVDIQRGESLQQPEVSTAVKELIKKKYIQSEIKTITTEPGERQALVYSLTKDVYTVMFYDLSAMVYDLLNKSDSYTSLIEGLIAMINKKEPEDLRL